MSGLDTFSFDADGHLDMSAFPDDGTDLSGSDLADLRETLLTDPVEEPDAGEWGEMVEELEFAVGDNEAGDIAGPFDVGSDLPGDGLETDALLDDGLKTAVVPGDVAADELAGDGAGGDDDLALDEDGVDGLELDGVDDFDSSFDFDATGEALADGLDSDLDPGIDDSSSATAGSDFEDLL